MPANSLKSTPEALAHLRTHLQDTVTTLLTPPPRLNLSDWANEYRYLSRESSPEPGKFRWERAPYMKEMLDVAGDYSTQKMVIMSSAQIGKTTVLETIMAYYMVNDPAPILMVLPELNTAKAFSTDRLDPMIRDCPVIRARVKPKRSRDSGNTLLQKRFLGGQLTMIGSNSPSGLRSRPIRVLLMDEVDAYDVSAGKEGDPVELAIARTSNFWNRKIILTSTPTITDLSRIEMEFKASDQRYYLVPCPHCGEFDKLEWSRMHWENHDPNTAMLVCNKCGCEIEEAYKMKMLRDGVWQAENPSSSVAGFHLNALYSPWKPWKELVEQFLKSKDNREMLKVFTNTVEGKTFNDYKERVEPHHLASHRETYKRGTVPNGVGIITAGVDVQSDRLEAYVWGWGDGEESWLLDRIYIDGDPGIDRTWQELSDALSEPFTTETGGKVKIHTIAVDTGHQIDRVQKWVKERKRLGVRVIGVKGSNSVTAPILVRPEDKQRVTNKKKSAIYSVGTNAAKDLIYARYKVATAGPGYVHLPENIGSDVLEQLTAERPMTKYEGRRAYRQWVNPSKARNEALDCLVYAMSALRDVHPRILDGDMLKKAADHVAALNGPTEAETKPQDAPQSPEPPKPVQMVRQRRPPSYGGLGSGWRTGWNV